ncbi:protocadherin gamma-A4-like [Rhinatrema bivittatum]|uniref:protocadherin gamma-A4-like n=1 Tax=Rhinatrema bivittatum TaxID=194408 RepID=UPI00112940EB|nr:protocadherin gamma-A4-like [Rhinatrema bivittatum]
MGILAKRTKNQSFWLSSDLMESTPNIRSTKHTGSLLSVNRSISSATVYMVMAKPRRCRDLRKRLLFFFIIATVWNTSFGHIRYSIPEEMETGSFVGNIANDLGLDIKELPERGIRIVSKGRTQYFILSLQDGHIHIIEKIDREELCGQKFPCVLYLEVLVENPIKLYRAEVEIQDINDNTPRFPVQEIVLQIIEITAPGTRFLLQEAQDPDVAMNSLQTYSLSNNKHFSLDVRTRVDGKKYAELVLEKPLDREEQSVHHLILTATDGGNPTRSGTVQIRVIVLDANDNAPVFNRSLYKVSVMENIPEGTVVARTSATDLDEGVNAYISYSFIKMTNNVSHLFQIDSKTGEISVLRNLDFEEAHLYEIEIEANDGAGLSGRSKIVIEVIDANDNAPEITVQSFLSPLGEDSPLGTVIALLNVHDGDSKSNGLVTCFIPENLPFLLQSSFDNYYSLVTEGTIDREQISEYNITITATDNGFPPLTTTKTILLIISDINDNPPMFDQMSYTGYIMENNSPGILISSVKATDPDLAQNAKLSYSIIESHIHESLLSSYISINSDTGFLYAMRSFNYEEFKEFQIKVKAEDGGRPSLSSNATVVFFIQDQNDNTPEILYPSVPRDGSTGLELAPRSSDPGYLVTKLVAIDADSGQNAWLSYQLLRATDPGLFTVGHHTGEIRTARNFLEKDTFKQVLIVLVKDSGSPSLSATVTVTVIVAESIPEVLSDLSSLTANTDTDSNLTLYLVISLASISCLFFTFLILLLALKLRKWRDSHLFDSSSVNFSVEPSTQYVGIDGVRAFLQTYSHEVCLTTDSRNSQLKIGNNSNTLKGDQDFENTGLNVNGHLLNSNNGEAVFIQVSFIVCNLCGH